MSKFEFPNKGDVSQMNKGEAFGSLYTSYGIDFSKEKGRIINSPNSLVHLSGYTTGTITSPVIGFAVKNSRWIGAADDVYRGGAGEINDPSNGWAIDTSTSTPQCSYELSDVVIFNDDVYVSGIAGAGDIYKYNGTAWSSWWQGTLSQTALSTVQFLAMKVSPKTGRLYILNGGNKVYNVTTSLTVTKTGNGTLDMSSTEHRYSCMGMASNRMWLGGRDLSTGEAVVLEWDMSLNESTANKIYRPGSTSVLSIVIWNDSPVLMLADGTMRFYDGANFYKKDGANLPKPPDGYVYRGNKVSDSIEQIASQIMHPNGSAVIDEMPHFLMAGTLRNSAGSNVTADDIRYFAGIFCYDPEIGLYNRFPIEGGNGTEGFGSNTISQVGALVAAPSPKTSFLASAMVTYQTDIYASIFSDDKSHSLASRGRFILNPFYGTAKDLWQKVEVLATRLKDSSDRILLKYRLSKRSTGPFKATITYVSATSFTSTDTDFANAAVGDFVMVNKDLCSSSSAHISAISYSNPTYTITLDEALTGWTSFLIGEQGEVLVDNFKRLATISNQKTDYHDLAVPSTEGSHTFWLMVEVRAAAGSVVELDKIIVTSKDGK